MKHVYPGNVGDMIRSARASLALIVPHETNAMDPITTIIDTIINIFIRYLPRRRRFDETCIGF
jgi:hypothetical protein